MDSEIDFDELHDKIVSALKNPAVESPEVYSCREGFWVPLEQGSKVDKFLDTVTSEKYNSCLHSVSESSASHDFPQTLNLTFLLTQKKDPLRGVLLEVGHCVDCYVWGVKADAASFAPSGTIPDLLAISHGHTKPEFVVSRARQGNVRVGFVDLAVDPGRTPFKLKNLTTTSSGDLMATVEHHTNKPWAGACDLKLVFPKGSTARTKTHLHFSDMSFKIA